jgi:ABC-type glutathione transport system ATPase component
VPWVLKCKELVVADSRGKVLIRIGELTVSFRRCLGVVGPSGSGKTLFGRALAGLLPIHLTMSGDIGVFPPSGDRSSSLEKALIQFLPQAPASALPSSIACGPLLERVLRWSGGCSSKAAALKIFRELGLDGDRLYAMQASQLSGGMAQRYAIALAFARRPTVLVLDEPTVGLDEGNVVQIKSLLDSIASSGIPTVIITHDLRMNDLFDTRIEMDLVRDSGAAE